MAIRLTESRLRQIIREEIEDLGGPGPQIPPVENYPMVTGNRGHTHVHRGFKSPPTYESAAFEMPDGGPVPNSAEIFMAFAPFILVDVKGDGNFKKMKLIGKVDPYYLVSPHIEEVLYAVNPNFTYLSRSHPGTAAAVRFTKR